MASVSVLFLLFSLITSSFLYTVKSENDFNDKFEIFYNTILRCQTEVNILNKKISDALSEKLVDSAGLLPQINSENEVSFEDLAKLYANIQTAKSSYGGKDSDMKKLYANIQDAKSSYSGKDLDMKKFYANIQDVKSSYGGKDSDMKKLYASIQDAKSSYGVKDLDMKKLYDNIQASKSSYGKVTSRNNVVASVNLTVYHHYEDVDKTGKKMQLFFGNQGPSDAVLLKRQVPINGSKQSEALCGSAIAVSGETRITRRAKTIRNETIGCHKKNVLPFAVYLCHHTENSVVRAVSLAGEDGIALKVFTVCHLNTSAWSPKHPVFRILNTKPGIPVCHFLTTDDIVWVHK